MKNKLSPDWSKLTLQQKICAMFQRTIKYSLHIFSKLCVSFKKDNSTTEKKWYLWKRKKCESNNPQLTKLMEKEMTFQELENEKMNLKEEKIRLSANIGYVNTYQPNKKWDEVYNNILDRISIIKDLLAGVDTKMRQIGFEYSVSYKKTVKKPFPSELEESYINEISVLIEEDFKNEFNQENVEKLLMKCNLETPYEILNIRQVKKK